VHDDDSVRRIPTEQIVLGQGKKYFINPGSIGQPRDRDWRAAYCVYDTDREVVEQRRVEYDLETAQRKIRAAGLPERLADRLAYGR
jgi:diadenosine tetraphosphatase ApaH/serine/threonine PP2A family protein phosphatase